MSETERATGLPHRPLDKRVGIFCFNLGAHSGFRKGDRCPFAHAQRIRPEGLHWAAQYGLVRRGGMQSGQKVAVGAVEGYLQALRNQNHAETRKSIDESKGVGREKHR